MVAPKGRRRPAAAAEPNEAIEDDPSDLSSFLDQLDGDAGSVRLYRMVGGEKRFLEKLGLSVSVEEIQERHGGGDFYLTLIDSRNRLVKGGARRVKIEGAPRMPPELAVPTRTEYSPNPAPAPARSLQESIEQLTEIVRDIRNPPAAAQTADPFAMTASLITAVAAAAAPFIEIMKRPEPAPAPAPREQLDDPMEWFKLGLRFGTRGGAPRDEPRDPLNRVLDQLGSVFDRAKALPAAGATSAPEKGMFAPSDDPANWRQAMSSYVDRLNKLAISGKDPELYADFAYDNAPPAVMASIVGEIGRGEAFYGEFFKAYPETEPQRAWWLEFFARVWSTDQHFKLQERGDRDAGGVSRD